MKSQFWAVFKKEVTSYFYSPLGYIFLIIFIFTSGFLTFEPGRGSFFFLRQSSLTPFFLYMPWLLLFLIPAISMRAWSEEKKTGTQELIFTLPVKTSQVVLAKFLSSWLFISLGIVLTFPLIISVYYLGSPDGSVILSGYIVTILLAGAMTAISQFFSSLTNNQVISFIMSLATCTAFVMAGSPPVLEFISSFFPIYVLNLIENLSVLSHFENGERGVWTASDLFFWFSMIIFWLFATTASLEENRG